MIRHATEDFDGGEGALINGTLQPLSVRWIGASAGDELELRDGDDNIFFKAVVPSNVVSNYTEESDLSRKIGLINDLNVQTIDGGSVTIYYRQGEEPPG